jgi:hypothetical protein
MVVGVIGRSDAFKDQCQEDLSIRAERNFADSVPIESICALQVPYHSSYVSPSLS